MPMYDIFVAMTFLNVEAYSRDHAKLAIAKHLNPLHELADRIHYYHQLETPCFRAPDPTDQAPLAEHGHRKP